MPEPPTLREFLEKPIKGIRVKITQIPKREDYFAKVWETDSGATHYETEIYSNGRTFIAYFSCGSAYGKIFGGNKVDVLATWILDSSYLEGSWEEYAGNFGFNEDSREEYADWQEHMKLIRTFVNTVGRNFIEKCVDLENDYS